jgi:hypothetical protein
MTAISIGKTSHQNLFFIILPDEVFFKDFAL